MYYGKLESSFSIDTCLSHKAFKKCYLRIIVEPIRPFYLIKLPTTF